MGERKKQIRLPELLKKYKFALIVILAGILLMLVPSLGSSAQKSNATDTADADTFSIEEQETKMEDTLGKMGGVGKVQVMLTLKSGTELHLAEDSDEKSGNESQTKTETVIINRGSGTQDIVVTKRIYPEYQGAVVVCQGADTPSIRLAVTEAVRALTGLSTDKISVVKWNS
ncbi:MAG: stage III sporulation protein AG [Clostridiales bacterium]|nr:stage III sporulation protein AG [Clostridiales bacterium]